MDTNRDFMGKRGPCDHCGIPNTPLWRNGPPEKPVLCNACGSRWRIRGTLANYIPKHALTDHISNQLKITRRSRNPSLDSSFYKVKQQHISISAGDNGDSDSKIQEKLVKTELDFPSPQDDNTSNGSTTSGSVISTSSDGRLPQLENTDGIDTSDSIVPPGLWESQVPSRKRSQRQDLSTVEKLHRDLLQILHDKKNPFIPVCTDGELIYSKNDDNPEIGLGCILLEDSITSRKK